MEQRAVVTVEIVKTVTIELTEGVDDVKKTRETALQRARDMEPPQATTYRITSHIVGPKPAPVS